MSAVGALRKGERCVECWGAGWVKGEGYSFFKPFNSCLKLPLKMDCIKLLKIVLFNSSSFIYTKTNLKKPL